MTARTLTSLLFALTALSFSVSHAQQTGKQPRIGLQKRIPWTTSRMIGSPDPPSPYVLERVFPKLTFKNPVVLTNAPGTGRLFAVELDGKVYSFPGKPSVAKPDLMFDIRKSVKGATRIYGLTFHPDFAKNRYCYVCYITKPQAPDCTRVSRFVVSKTDPPTIDPKSEQLLITWKSGGHNGGCLKFGPDGYLYISTGDGAGAFPPDDADTGQRIDDLLASILRIDVDHAQDGRPYRIPPDNPFINTKGARGEVWSYGHRNPWKMSFDAKTGDLWVGDVGWEMWEMIYRVHKGDNFGWSVVESTQPVHPERKLGPTPVVPATIAHSHTEARSITGGFVYRGTRLPELAGAYIYGDYVTGKIWGAKHDGKRVTSLKELTDSTLQVICFGEDNDRELYVVTYDGTIHRLVKNTAAQANRNFPKKLSETGLFASTRDHKVAPGVIGYSIIAEPWMDGATAKRYVALPGKSTLGIHTDNNPQKGILKGEWQYPENSVLMKTIFLKLADGTNRRVETQILHRVSDTWKAYNYVWNNEQTDAVFLEGPGRDRTFRVSGGGTAKRGRQQTWHHASRTECLLCHTTRGGSVYGFLPEQLDRPHRYSRRVGDQLATLKHVAVFDHLPRGKRPKFERITGKHDSPDALARAARTYLHVNCGTCHRRGGGGTSKFELLFSKSAKDKYLYEVRPTQGTFGIHNAKVIAPGDPYRSVLLYRMAKLGRGRMPHFGSDVVDGKGLHLIRDWIASLKPVSHPASQDALKSLARVTRKDRVRELLSSKLLSQTETAFALAVALRTGTIRGRKRRQIIDVATKHPDPQIRDLFEPFLPEEQRVKRLGTTVDAVALLKLEGDAARGRQLFLRTTGVSCANCHKIGDKGKEIGPDLALAAKKNTRAQLLESILQPSKKIDRKYLVYLVETKQGKVFTGLLKQRDAKQVVLIDSQAKEIRIPAGDVEQLVPQRKSLMPELLFRDMTAKQLADLLAFLKSLK